MRVVGSGNRRSGRLFQQPNVEKSDLTGELNLQCDGVRPRCNTCQSKNLSCVYDVAEDGKTTTQLRTHVRRLERELEDVKSILPLLIVTPNQTAALEWASEIKKHGFSHHSFDEIRKSLQVSVIPWEHKDSMD